MKQRMEMVYTASVIVWLFAIIAFIEFQMCTRTDTRTKRMHACSHSFLTVIIVYHHHKYMLNTHKRYIKSETERDIFFTGISYFITYED